MNAFIPDRISIIVPVYNAEAYLPAALDSLRGQTYADLDIIMINDGSTDRSSEICAQYAAADGRFRAFSQPNGGSGAARNAGLRQVKGEFFTFLDADDTLDPAYCEKLLALLREEHADLAVCNFEKNGHAEAKWGPGCFEGDDILREFAEGGFYNRTPNKLYRSALFAGLAFAEGMDYAEDAVWTARVLSIARRVARIPDALYHYRFVENSLSNTPVKPQKRMCAYYVNVLQRDEIILQGLLPKHERAQRKIALEALDIMASMTESWFDLTLFDAYSTARAFIQNHRSLLARFASPEASRMLADLSHISDPRQAQRIQRRRALLSPAIPIKRKARLLFRAKNHLTRADR